MVKKIKDPTCDLELLLYQPCTLVPRGDLLRPEKLIRPRAKPAKPSNRSIWKDTSMLAAGLRQQHIKNTIIW